MTQKEKEDLSVAVPSLLGGIGFYVLFWFVFMKTSEVPDERFPVYILYFFLKFWCNNGFALVFGYVALFTVVSGFTLKGNAYYEFLQKRLWMIFAIGFYLVLSLLSALIYPCLERVSDELLVAEYGYCSSFVFTALSAVLCVMTVAYAHTLYGVLMDMLKTESAG